MVCRKEISFFDSHYIMRKNRKKEEKFDELSIILLPCRKSRHGTAGCTNKRGKSLFSRQDSVNRNNSRPSANAPQEAPAALRPNGSLTCFSHCVSILCENTSNCCKKRRMARCTVWTALLCEILDKMNKFDMKRQETVSLDRIKRPGPVALTKPERMLCAQSKPVNEPPFGAVFCCTQLISASRYEGRARPPRRRSSTVLWRTHWEIIDI